MALNRMRPVYPEMWRGGHFNENHSNWGHNTVYYMYSGCGCGMGVSTILLHMVQKIAVDFCWIHSQFLGGDRVLTLHSHSSKYGAYWSDHPLNLLYN